MSEETLRDSAGTVFDAAVHRLVKGKPQLRKDGTFVPLKGKKHLSPPSELTVKAKKAAMVAKIAPEKAGNALPDSDGTASITAQDSGAIMEKFGGEDFPEITAQPMQGKAEEVPPAGESVPPPKFGNIAPDAPAPSAGGGNDGLMASMLAVTAVERIGVMLWGEGMKMQDAERQELFKAYSDYLGEVDFKLPPWANVALLTGSYFFVRLEYIGTVQRKRKAEKKTEEKPATTAPDDGVPVMPSETAQA